MLEYSDFYDIAVYGNEAWKGSFSDSEIAVNAYIYFTDFQWSKENGKVSFVIQELAKLLVEDGSDECKDWLYEMATELGLLDMNFMDYMETDADIISCFLSEKEITTETEEVTISGIIFQHGTNDYSLCTEFSLTKEEHNTIMKILENHINEGGSVRGTRKEIAREMEE